jgi:hypothetical protein
MVVKLHEVAAGAACLDHLPTAALHGQGELESCGEDSVNGMLALVDVVQTDRSGAQDGHHGLPEAVALPSYSALRRPVATPKTVQLLSGSCSPWIAPYFLHITASFSDVSSAARRLRAGVPAEN